MLTSVIRKVQYVLTYPFGATYAVTFAYWATDQVYAVLSFDDGTADQTLVEDTDYTLTAPGASGTLTKVSDWNHAAIRLTIYREIVVDQQTDYRNGEAVDMDMLEQDLDVAAARDQQIWETIQRTVTIPITDPAASMQLPAAGSRRGLLLGCDSTPEANIIPVAGTGGVVTSPAAATVLDDPTTSAMLTTLGVSDFVKTLLDDATPQAAKATLEDGVEIFTPLGGYSPAAGDVIETWYDGTIRKAKQYNSLNIESGSTVVAARIAKLDATKAVMVYAVGLAIKAVVVTIDPVTLLPSLGTPQTVFTCTTNLSTFDVAYGGDSTHVLVAYTANGGAASQLAVRTLTISGTTITVNSAVNGLATATNGTTLCAIPGTTNVLMVYQVDSTHIGHVVVSGCNGNSPTINTVMSIAVTSAPSTAGRNMGLDVAPDGVHGLVVWLEETAGADRYNSITISGLTLLAPEQNTSLGGVAAYACPVVFCTPAGFYGVYMGDMVHTMQNMGGSASPIFATPGYGDPWPKGWGAGNNVAFAGKAIDAASGHFFLAYTTPMPNGTGAGTYGFLLAIARRVGKSASFQHSDPIVVDLNSNLTVFKGGGDVLSSGILVCAFGTNVADKSFIYAVRRRNTILGVAVDGTGKVRTRGIYTTAGLTPGATYYCDSAGALSTTPSDLKMGVAVSTTQLHLAIAPGL